MPRSGANRPAAPPGRRAMASHPPSTRRPSTTWPGLQAGGGLRLQRWRAGPLRRDFPPDPGGPAWQARHGLSSAQYQATFDQLVAGGYRLELVSGYSVAGQDRFAAIWTK